MDVPLWYGACVPERMGGQCRRRKMTSAETTASLERRRDQERSGRFSNKLAAFYWPADFWTGHARSWMEKKNSHSKSSGGFLGTSRAPCFSATYLTHINQTELSSQTKREIV